MRWIVAFIASLTLATGVMAANFPQLTGRVVDNAHLLSAATQQALEEKLAGLEQTTKHQLVVVTVDSLHGQPIEEFGYQLGRHWGIGRKGEDDGVMLIVAPAERKVRIEVGYGLEGSMTDAVTSQIIQSIILPQFKQGQMEAGVVQGAEAIASFVGGNGLSVATPATTETDPFGLLFILCVVVMMFSQVFLLIFYAIAWCFAKLLSLLGFNVCMRWLSAFRLRHNPKNLTFWMWLATPSPRINGSYGGGFTFTGGGGGFGGGGSSGSW